MHLSLSALALSLTLPLTSAFEVYIHPTPSSLKSKRELLSREDAAALASHHLGLDMFERLSKEASGALAAYVGGDVSEGFVGKGDKKEDVALVVMSSEGVQNVPTLERPVMSLPDSIVTEADDIIDLFVDRAKYVYDSISHWPSSSPFSSSSSSFTVYDLRTSPSHKSILDEVFTQCSKVVVISTSSSPFAKRGAEEGVSNAGAPPPQFPLTALSGCFTSYSDCTNATDGCSGHGSCAEAKRDGRSCFMCACESTKEQVKTGEKTTNWVGESCEKKDYSSSFALLAGTTIALILAAVGSVSLLYSIGDNELPSTLMAGAGASKRD